MRAGASSTAITRSGARCATRRSTDRMIGFAQALPAHPPQDQPSTCGAGSAARKGAGDGRPAAREDADSRRQRRVRALEPLVRPDDAARRARRRSRASASGSRSAARAASSTRSICNDRRLAKHRQAVPRPSGLRAVPVPTTRTANGRPSARRTSTPTSRRSPGRISPRRTSGPGPAPCSRRSSCASSRPFTSNDAGEEEHRRRGRSGGERLGNTKAVCRKCYIHPAIFDCVHGRLDARDDRAAGAEGVACGRSVDGDGALGALAAAPPPFSSETAAHPGHRRVRSNTAHGRRVRGFASDSV